MVDRLVELIMTSRTPLISRPIAKTIAEDLIENGVIVPPCKVGQTVYCLIKGFKFVSEGRVRSITMYDNCMAIEIAVYGYYAQRRTNKDFGHSVFLTKEEAEQALKGGADNE